MTRSQDTLIGILDPNYLSFRTALEQLIAALAPVIEYRGVRHVVKTRRISTRPYNVLGAICPYRAIVNRGAHWNPFHNSYFMTVQSETYLLNDMIAFHAINKNTGYGQMAKLGLKIPKTIALPQQDYSEMVSESRVYPELIFGEHEFFDVAELGAEVGYPAYLKPQSGGGWIGVVRVNNAEELLAAYNKSGEKACNLQAAVDYREFVRTVGIGPQTFPMHYNASAAMSHDRYLRSPEQAVEFGFLSPGEDREVRQICKFINAFYSWHHNSCEALIAQDTGDVHPIDFCNAYPDSALTSLHFWFPELVKAMARWLIFCAVTGRIDAHFQADWPKYQAVVAECEKQGLDYHERLNRFEKIADAHFQTAAFEDFCGAYLPDFDRQALDYFTGGQFDEVLVRKVRHYFRMPQEHAPKIAHYRGIHSFWCHCERRRLGLSAPAAETPAADAAPVAAAAAPATAPAAPAAPAANADTRGGPAKKAGRRS